MESGRYLYIARYMPYAVVWEIAFHHSGLKPSIKQMLLDEFSIYLSILFFREHFLPTIIDGDPY